MATAIVSVVDIRIRPPANGHGWQAISRYRRLRQLDPGISEPTPVSFSGPPAALAGAKMQACGDWALG